MVIQKLLGREKGQNGAYVTEPDDLVLMLGCLLSVVVFAAGIWALLLEARAIK